MSIFITSEFSMTIRQMDKKYPVEITLLLNLAVNQPAFNVSIKSKKRR